MNTFRSLVESEHSFETQKSTEKIENRSLMRNSTISKTVMKVMPRKREKAPPRAPMKLKMSYSGDSTTFVTSKVSK